MKGVMLAIGAPKSDDKAEVEDGEAEESDELAAAANFRAALKGNDNENLLLAFKALMKVC